MNDENSFEPSDSREIDYQAFLHAYWPQEQVSPESAGIAEKRAVWAVDGSGVNDYGYRFGPLFAREFIDFKSLADEIKARIGRPPVVVDFMGGCEAIQGMECPGFGLRLSVPAWIRSSMVGAENRSVIAGDILRQATWQELDEKMLSQGFDTIDVAFFSPVGGFKYLPNNPNIYWHLMNEIYKRVSKDQGMIFAQVSERSIPFVMQWASWLRGEYQPQSIDAELERQKQLLMGQGNIRLAINNSLAPHRLILGVIKTPDSPDSLPNYQDVETLDRFRKGSPVYHEGKLSSYSWLRTQ